MNLMERALNKRGKKELLLINSCYQFLILLAIEYSKSMLKNLISIPNLLCKLKRKNKKIKKKIYKKGVSKLNQILIHRLLN